MFNLDSRLTRLLAAGLFGGAALVAQQSTGGLKGRVTDKTTGAPKGGVAITIEHTATGFTRAMVSANDGSFRFPVLPIGNYRLTFKTPDAMASMIRTVQLGQETEVYAVLKPRAEATVTVVATADTVGTVNTTSAEQSVNVSAERLESLPVLSRNVMSAAILAPGVQLVQGSAVDPTKKSSTYISTGEGQGRGVNMSIDGGDNNSTDVGGYVSSIPIDAIGEFQVVTNMYKAEFGRSNAGFFNIVSKAGTNEFTGAINAQYTNQSMRARSTDEGTKKDNNVQNVSAVVGGPIIKDTLFYMLSAEKRDEEGAPATFSPSAIGYYPVLGSIKTKIDALSVYGRFDWNMNSMMSLMLTGGYSRDKTPNQIFPWGAGQNGYIEPSLLGTGKNETWRGTLKFTANFSPALTWESNVTYFDYTNKIFPNGPGSGDNTNLFVFCIQSALAGGPTSDSVGFAFGHDPNAFQNTGIKRLQWRNDVNYVMGDHFFKGGLDFQHFKYADQLNFDPITGPDTVRIVGFNSPDAMGSTVAADENVASIRLRAQGFQKGDTIKQYGFYLQDDWTINTHWSLYLGVRVDKDTVFDFMKDYRDLYRQINATSPGFIRGADVPKDKTYVSPRIQAVWKPLADDSLTFKAGYGKFIAQVVDNVTGWSRSLANRVNGLPGTTWNNATYAFANQSYTRGGRRVPSFKAHADWSNIPVNGHIIDLPADFTPYNYVNNVGGLRDYFGSTVDSWLRTASFETGGKQLLASDFQYPQTDAFSFGMAIKFSEKHNLDLSYAYSWTDHNSVEFTTDGSDPRANSIGPAGGNMSDTIFLSNQRAASHQFMAKYTYTTPKLNFFMSVVVRDNKSSNGSSAGSFVSGGNADFYGNGTGGLAPYIDGKLRRSAGTELLTGSMALNYSFDIGTKVGLLGTWHSGKFYDVTTGWSSDLGPGNVDVAHPTDYAGYREGDWNMDLSLRVSHPFKFGQKMVLEPFVQVQNLLNNYDYGSNYGGTLYQGDGVTRDPAFGKRLENFQANQPRTAAFGFRFTF